MNNEEQIISTLNQILEVQRKALSNQEQAITQQLVAVQRQAAHLKLYKVVLLILAPVMAYMIYVFASIPRPH